MHSITPTVCHSVEILCVLYQPTTAEQSASKKRELDPCRLASSRQQQIQIGEHVKEIIIRRQILRPSP